MSNVARLPVIAAVAMVAVVGIALLSPSSSPSAASVQRPPTTTLSRTVEGVRFSFNLPRSGGDGWTPSPIAKGAKGFREGRLGISKSIVGPQGAEAIVFWTSFPDGYRADPCAYLASRQIGRSTADLAAAVARAPGTKLISGPSNVRIGGLPAKHVVLIVRRDLGCDPGYFFSWHSECWGPCWVATNVGDTIRVWVVDVDGTRLFIAAATTEQANARLRNEVFQIVQTIRFE